MNGKRTPGRSLDEWLELVTSCRQSGLTAAAWCHENGISPSCFYNAVSRLRKRACEILQILLEQYAYSEIVGTFILI